MSSISTCRSGSQNLETEHLLPRETDGRFFTSSTTSAEGIQVIVPQMRFTCTGRITAWNAHTLINTRPNFIEVLTHHITFQVWRPADSIGSSYSLVGSNELSFKSKDFQDGITPMSSTTQTSFFSFSKAVEQDTEIYFEPGDVLGWYIGPQYGTISPPLSTLFRGPQMTDKSSSVVDMLVNDAAQEGCSLCSVRDTFEAHYNVVPMVSVTYGKYVCVRIIKLPLHSV